MMKKLLFILSALLPSVTVAEDIDLYIGTAASRAATKPQVLLIFDNSGSMGNKVETVEAYQLVGRSHGIQQTPPVGL